MKAWREKNADRMKQYGEEYRKTHRERRREYNRQWREENRDYWRDYQSERLRTDPTYRLRNYISASIRRAIKKDRKSAFKILGYSVDDLRHRLESLFQPGMSWENYGSLWHIDHIIPKSWFNLTSENGIDEYELRLCWSLENLQPLWADENLEKKDRYISHTEPGHLQMTCDRFRLILEPYKQNGGSLNPRELVQREFQG
ncbi:MAG: hypothetical protein L0229_07135 [Blastocatellia bacterium]|nr:hypothetical protein [Blastocatellia bacterium]